MGNQTHIYVHLHILRPEGIGGPIGFCGVAGGLDVGIKIENTDREFCQDGSACLVIVARTGDGDRCRVGFRINGIGSGKAGRQFHVVQFPMVDVVEVNHSGNGMDGFNGGGFQIHPIHRAEEDSVQRRIVGYHVDGRSCNARLHFDYADDNGLVARIVANFKLHAVESVCHLHSAGRQNAVGKAGRHFHAVDIDFCRSGIQT